MDYKNTNAQKTTVTRSVKDIRGRVQGNIYEAVVLLSRRANQINSGMKEELHAKLKEFATHQDNLEEIFENREQIEISKLYERLPKPHSIALEELNEDNIYYRYPDSDIENTKAEE